MNIFCELFKLSNIEMRDRNTTILKLFKHQTSKSNKEANLTHKYLTSLSLNQSDCVY